MNAVNTGHLLRAVRARRIISQRELAALAGVQRSTVSRIESGQTRNPTLALMDHLVRSAGFALVVVDQFGRLLALDEERSRLRDRGDRLYPAHFSLFQVKWAGPPWWGWSRIAWLENEPAVPKWSFYRRPTGDRPFPYWWLDAT
jgi:transcriptional regulator with XRE-family HTH domain